jgi:SAM-dependent methyltransferase
MSGPGRRNEDLVSGTALSSHRLRPDARTAVYDQRDRAAKRASEEEAQAVEPSAVSYDRSFYEYVDGSARSAAQVVVPMLFELLPVSSVIDIGCGTGGWLHAFGELGVTDVLGLDSGRVPDDLLKIEPSQFRVVDLTNPPTVDRTFDLALSLEVAEHLPSDAADRFVAFLCSLAPVVAFSAAIPGQGGEEHLNEQWPSYWAARFADHGFAAVDVVRGAIWDDERVDWFYRQNLLLYVDDGAERRLRLPSTAARLPTPPLALVHPETFTSYRTWAQRAISTPPSLSAHLRALPGATRRALSRRWKALRERIR